MNSIPHPPRARMSPPPPMPTIFPEGQEETAGDQVRGFFYDARRAITSGDYLLRKWLPILGPDLFTLIKVLRSMCYFSRETGELRDQCWPTYETLAAKCGVKRATIGRWLKRDTSGQFVWLQKGEDGKKRLVWSPLNLFLQVQRRRRYCAKHQHRVQTSNLYLVALDDPLTPEDEEELERREAEIALLQARAQSHTHTFGDPRPDVMRGDTEAQNETQNAGAKRASECRLKMSRNIVPGRDALNNDFDRSMGERLLVSEEKQGATEALSRPREATQEEGQEELPPATRHTNQAGSRGRPRRSIQDSKGTRMNSMSTREQVLAEATQIAGSMVAVLLEDLGASNPAGGTQTILEALVEAGAPLEQMGALASLGLNRLRQQLALGNPIENQAGYYIAIMRDLALEALVKRWDTAQIEQEDAAKFEQALRSVSARVAKTQEEAATDSILTKEESSSVDEVAEADHSDPISVADRYLPDGVALLEEAELATLSDYLPDPSTGQPRTLSMLWGFVREAMRPCLNLPRRQHLDALIPKWDATRPRTLLLLSKTIYTARFVEQALRVEFEQQIDKLLAHYFDEVQVAYAPASNMHDDS